MTKQIIGVSSDGKLTFNAVKTNKERLDDHDEQLAEMTKKLNYVSVTDFGAKLDGSDDTSALRDAWTYAWQNNIRNILIPGQMTVASSSQIIFDSTITLFGYDYTSCGINFTSPTGGLRFYNATSTVYETHIKDLFINGKGACTDLLEFENCTNIYLTNLHLGASLGYLATFKSSSMVFVTGGIWDGAFQNTWKRQQKGFSLTNTNYIVCKGINIWDLDMVFDIYGQIYDMLDIADCWIERHNTLFKLNGATGASYGTINLHDSVVYLSQDSGQPTYAWNLLTTNFANEASPPSIYYNLLVKNVNLFSNPSQSTFNNNAYCYVQNIVGYLKLDIDGLYMNGQPPAIGSGTYFVGCSPTLLTSLNSQIQFLHFNVSGLDFTQAINKTAYVWLENLINQGTYKKPIAAQGIKLWEAYNNNVEGWLRYDTSIKTLYLNDSEASVVYLSTTKSGNGSPIGVVTSEHSGQVYIDGQNGRIYVSTHVDNTSWKLVGVSANTNVAVSASATTLVVASQSFVDTNYMIDVSPAWNTTWWITNKSISGFTINFGTAPASATTLDWVMKR